MLRYVIILLFLVKIDAQLVHPVSESTLYQTHVKFEWLENPQANQAAETEQEKGSQEKDSKEKDANDENVVDADFEEVDEESEKKSN